MENINGSKASPADSWLSSWYAFLKEDPWRISIVYACRTWSRQQVEEASGKIYAYLVSRNIGREQFVLSTSNGGPARLSPASVQ